MVVKYIGNRELEQGKEYQTIRTSQRDTKCSIYSKGKYLGEYEKNKFEVVR